MVYPGVVASVRKQANGYYDCFARLALCILITIATREPTHDVCIPVFDVRGGVVIVVEFEIQIVSFKYGQDVSVSC
jgi:hypothetical protein